MGVPAVVLVTAPFEQVARAAATSRGLPHLPIVVFPAGFDDLDDERVAAVVDAHIDEIVAGLVAC